jgi:hypothetical protein
MLVTGSLSGCGGSVPVDAADSSDDSPAAAAPVSGSPSTSGTISRPEVAPAPATQGPTISGTAYPSVMTGQFYSFQPQVSGASGALIFKITNKPSWATFSAATGKLSGTPASKDAGAYKSILVTVTDAKKAAAALPVFSITVAAAPAADSSVSLSWTAPTRNSDGSALVDLEGYNVHYGTKSLNYSNVIKVSNPGLTAYVVQNLARGKYYFSVSAYNGKGIESSFSGEASASVDN